jgi:hypothetical protein
VTETGRLRGLASGAASEEARASVILRSAELPANRRRVWSLQVRFPGRGAPGRERSLFPAEIPLCIAGRAPASYAFLHLSLEPQGEDRVARLASARR